ncbi:hypothetical protein FGO68_gene14666 [Halteria grandinella]|uniref:TRP C-terminal domain-containing protein n=1 Tax=Halteria grandinella TaxID=5974 RepID=A0A8J8SX08_HALGN|nr:hypothetical protein FGO68_gene14666 [Halteria grandinella]
MMWGLMNTMQLIAVIFKFNLLVPPNVYMFFKSIEEFLSMKGKFINNIVEWVNEKIFKLNSELSDGLKGSPIKNMGSYLLGAIAITLAMTLTGLIAFFGTRFAIVKKLLDSLKNKLFYNSLLRLGIQSYLKNAILVASGWMLMSYESNQEFKKSVIIIIMSVVVFVYPIAIGIFLLKKEQSLRSPSIRAQFESAYANLKISKASLLSPTIFMFRRLLLAMALGLLQDYTFLQLFYVQLASSFYILYIYKVQPYEVSFLNTIEIVNELNLSACSFFAIFLTDYEPFEGSSHLAEVRNQIGWVIISLCSFNILTTVFKILSDVSIKIKGLVDARIQKARIEQMMREVEQAKDVPASNLNKEQELKRALEIEFNFLRDEPCGTHGLTALSQSKLYLQDNDFYYRADDKAVSTPHLQAENGPHLKLWTQYYNPQIPSPSYLTRLPSEAAFMPHNESLYEGLPIAPSRFSNDSCSLPNAINNMARAVDNADERLREIYEDIYREEVREKRPLKAKKGKKLSKRR